MASAHARAAAASCGAAWRGHGRPHQVGQAPGVQDRRNGAGFDNFPGDAPGKTLVGKLVDQVGQFALGQAVDEVGGGSAGATLAARLSAESRNRVLLIEAGRNYTPDNVPREVKDTFFRAVYNPRNLWPGVMVHWQPVPHNAPETAVARRYEQARIIGGGSSVNAMIALRGVLAS